MLLDAGATVDALGGVFGGCTSYVEATIFEQSGAAQLLLDRAFQFACRAGRLEAARFLLARGADPAAIGPNDGSARDEAADNGHHDVVRWLDELDT